jgi:hypothetical protein
LHGCASEDSDFDFIALVEGPYFNGGKLVSKEKGETAGIEISTFHLVFFLELVRMQVIWTIIVGFYPKEFVFMENISLRQEMGPIRIPALHTMLFAEVKFKWGKVHYLLVSLMDRLNIFGRLNREFPERYLSLQEILLKDHFSYDTIPLRSFRTYSYGKH